MHTHSTVKGNYTGDTLNTGTCFASTIDENKTAKTLTVTGICSTVFGWMMAGQQHA
jgi:hypothetical protein